MDYGYKPTTTGRAILAACLSTQKPLELTRVAFGCGTVTEGTNLADVHELVNYVAEGSFSERTHENDRLYFTVQYDNKAHPDLGTFYLSEFIVYAIHPDTGKEADLLYATLGDYKQPVPAYNDSLPPSVWKFPLVMVVSDEVNVSITGTPGLVTYEDMQAAIERAGNIRKTITFTIPKNGWAKDQESVNSYLYYFDVIDEEINEKMLPKLIVAEACMDTAMFAGVYSVDTYDGYIRVKCMDPPDADIIADCHLFAQYENSNVDGGIVVNPGIATDEEVKEVIDNIFGGDSDTSDSGGASGSDTSYDDDVATDEEVRDVVTDIFG